MNEQTKVRAMAWWSKNVSGMCCATSQEILGAYYLLFFYPTTFNNDGKLILRGQYERRNH